MKATNLMKATFAAVFGFAALAVHATEWTYYDKDATDNPRKGITACITDGNWILTVESKNGSTISMRNPCYYQGSGILDLRKVTTDTGTVLNLNFGKGYAFNGRTDLTEAYVDNLTSMGESMFYGCTNLTKVSLSGTFKQVGKNGFYNCLSLTNVVLSSPDLSSKWGSYAWGANKARLRAFERLEITTDSAVALDENTMGMTPMKTVIVNGPIWTQTNFDYLLKGVTATTADKNCTIYADKDAWADLATTLTDDEKVYKPKKCFGVYREGLRKAWLVSNAKAKNGFAIIVR